MEALNNYLPLSHFAYIFALGIYAFSIFLVISIIGQCFIRFMWFWIFFLFTSVLKPGHRSSGHGRTHQELRNTKNNILNVISGSQIYVSDISLFIIKACYLSLDTDLVIIAIKIDTRSWCLSLLPTLVIIPLTIGQKRSLCVE